MIVEHVKPKLNNQNYAYSLKSRNILPLKYYSKAIEGNLSEACYDLMGTTDKIDNSEIQETLLKGGHTINLENAKEWISILEGQKQFAKQLGNVYEY